MFLVKSRFLKSIFFSPCSSVVDSQLWGSVSQWICVGVGGGGFEGRWICYDKSNDDFLGLAGGNKVERENGSKGAGGIKKKWFYFLFFLFPLYVYTIPHTTVPSSTIPPAPESEGINTPWPNHPISSLTTGSPSMWVLFFIGYTFQLNISFFPDCRQGRQEI